MKSFSYHLRLYEAMCTLIHFRFSSRSLSRNPVILQNLHVMLFKGEHDRLP